MKLYCMQKRGCNLVGLLVLFSYNFCYKAKRMPDFQLSVNRHYDRKPKASVNEVNSLMRKFIKIGGTQKKGATNM